MSLSKDLISQFVKATKDTTTVKKESTVYGTVVKYNEKTYVKIDGSDLLTPAETLSSVEEGERVSIMIKDHTATITGNYTAPSASSIKVDGMDADLKANTADIKNLIAKNAEIENLVATKASIEDLKAANAEIGTLKADYAEIENLVADKASIGDLAAVNADIKSLKADKADIAHLEANYATIGSLNAVYADVTRLEADKANITDLEANYATIEQLEANYATIKQLDAANANITNLQAETANINTALIDKANVSDLAAANALIADLKAGKADVGDLTAANAKIANLEAGKADITHLEANYATIKQLDAANANITNLQTETANINTALIDKANVSDLAAANAVIDDLKAGKADIADLTAANAKIANLEANKADISVLEANYATIKQLDATNANVTNLQTETANINKALIDKADVSDLNATNANVTNLQATKANVSDLNATNANVNTLTGNLADITTLVNGNLTSDNIQSMVITGDKFTVEDGFIKNAMIDSVNANKINTGVINTNNVKIQSNDGSMLLQGNLQQFKDKNGKVRIQIGKDATGNFTFVLYDENGTGQLINQNGIQSSNAIADGLIVDSKVADNANIAGSKLDIDSVVTEVNNGTTSIKGTKIYLDDQKQALNVAFNNMSTTVKGNTNTIQSHTTSINTMNGKVTQLISDTTITKQDGTTTSLKDAYNATVDTVDSHSTKIGSLETNLATANNNISSVSSKQATLEQNLNGFKQTVSQTYATKTSVTDVSNNLKNNYSTTSAMNSAINQKANEITSSVSETYATKTSLKATDDKFANYSTTSQMNSAINQKSDSILSTVSNTYTTKADFNGLRVGGTNLVKNSKLFSSVISNNGWQILNTGSEGYKKLFIETTDPNWKEIYIPLYSAINSLKDKITISFDYTETKSGLLSVGFAVFNNTTRLKELDNTQANTLKVIGNPDGWKRVSYTIDPTSLLNQTNATQYGVQFKKFINLTGSIQIKKVQVEIGTIATEWNPAPQDIDTAISTIDGKFTNYSTTSQMNSAINQKANEITSTVSETYATKASLTTVDNKFANYSTTSAMNTAINQKANEITSSVSQTYATKTSVTDVSNNLKNNYSTTSAMNTAINQKSDAILSTVSKTYATQTSVTDVSNNLKNNYSTTSAMNSAINQKANEITSTVSETYATKTALTTVDNKFANYSTTSAMNSAINQKGDSILSTVSNTYTTKADFNNLSIGGTNLIANSAPKSTSGWQQYAGSSGSWTLSLVDCSSSTYGKAIRATSNNAAGGGLHKQPVDYTKLVKNEYYTLSAWIRASKNCRVNFINEYMEHGNFINITTEWKYYSYTDKLTGSGSHSNIVYLSQGIENGMWIEVHSLKLEKGTKSSSWSPAPQDIDDSITTVDNKFTNYSTTSAMNSAINQKANEITSTVSETYATKTALTTVDNKFANYSTTSAMNTAINQKSDAILSTVSSTYATKTSLKATDDKFANYSTTSQMNSAINQKGDSILSTVSSTYATKTALNTVDGKFANYSTTSAMNSAINQKGDSILSTVSNTYTTKADFNDLTIGGRNFLVGTKNAFTKAINTNDYTTNDPYTTYKSQTLSSLGLKVGDKITVSFDWSLSNVTTAGNFRVETVQDGAYKSLISGPHNFGSNTSGRYVGTKTLTSSDVSINKIRIRVDASNLTMTIKNMKLEKGNKYTSWSPAPEDIDSAISTVDGKFVNYSTTSQMNSAINQKANEITSSVSQTYATKTALNTVDGKFANYSTTSAMNTAINQKANEITSSVSNTYTTKTEFGNLRVGGTNLVKNSKLFGSVISNPGGWAIQGTGSEGYKKLFIETTSTDWKEIYIPLYSAINSLKDKITISFDYTETKSGLLSVGFAVFNNTTRLKELDNTQANTLKVIGNPDGWKRVSYTIDPTSLLNQANATQYGLQFKKFINLTGSIQIKKVQVEIGTIATEWSPAPQDTEGSINSLTTRMSNAESKLTKDSLTTTIGSYYTTSNDVNGLITSKGYATTSQVSQTATDLTAKFSSSGGYNLLRNSIFTRNGEYWTIDSTYTTIDTSRTFNGHNSLKINSTGATSDVWIGPKQRFAENIPSGKTYTASLWYYVADKKTFNSEFRLELKGKKTGASGESGIADTMIAASNLVQGAWTKVTVTATTRESWKYLFIYPWVKRNGTIWITELQVEEGPLATLWSPHPSEIYDGITQINKDGIKVYHSNINGENYTHMASSGFYIKNKGVDIFKVDTNGLYVKGNGEFTGKVTSTSGSIGGFNISEYNIKGTNVGMGCSSGHDYAFWAGASTGGSAPFKVDHDGSLVATSATITGNVTVTGGSVPSTILTGTIDNARLNSTIVNGAANGSSAKSTLDSKANGWDSAKSTVDNNKTNWSNAYNRVVQWASGSVTGNTTINGGLIQTGTVTAKQLYLGDLTNYCNLREETASLYGFTSESSSWGTWYKLNNNQRDICISGNKVNDYGYYKCLGGESFRIKFEVKSNVKGSSTNGGSDSVYCGVNIGLYGKLGDGNTFYQIPSSGYVGDANSTEGHINVWTTLPSNARTFGVFLQLSGWGNWSGTCRIKNVQVFRMSSGELIVDGSITANKINVSDLSALNATIGGFSMYNGKLVGTGGNGVGMSGNGTDWAFWAGSNTGGNAPFHVGHEGNLYATQAHITGTITGSTINAGTINGATINSDSFIGDMLAIDGTISAKSLQVQDIDNAKYPGAVTADFKLYVSTSGNDDSEIENGATFATFDALLDKLPKNLNGHEVRIEMSTNITENVDFKGFFGGKIRLYMKGHTLYGYVVSRMGSARINICSGYIGNASDTSNGWGKIHPSKGYAVSSYTTTVASVDQGAIGLYNIDVYGADNYLSGSTTKLGVAGQDWGTAYLNGVSYYGCDMGARANAGGRIHDVLSYNVCKKYGFYATTGGYITLAGGAHSGGKTKNYHEADAGKVIVASDATFASGEASVPGESAPVVPTTKTITIKSTYGDTYRSSVYNNWKKDGTVRQGDYGYGDCNGCWFFGDAFSDVEGKSISKVTIKITRQSGGSSSAVGLVVKSHGHSGRPSGAPSYRTTAGTLSLATGASGTLTITDSTILNEIKSGAVKGFGIQTTYDSSHYAVCSGSVTVKITYTE